MSEPGEGFLLASDSRGVWAWTAVRVEAAADLTETSEYSSLPEQERLVKAVAAEAAWVASQWETADDSRLELRYLHGQDDGRLACAVLGRVFAPDHAGATAAAERLQRRLLMMPRHVHVTPVRDPGAVASLLRPFEPHPEGLVDIRKRIRLGTPARPDAGVAYYLAVEPFTVGAPDWEQLWRAMVAHRDPLLLTVGLQPLRSPPELGAMLHELATHYGRLAAPSRLPGGIWGADRELAPDAFAADAVRLFGDAGRRYTGQVFRVRIGLASPAPISDALVELLGLTISPPRRARDAGALTETFEGAAHVAVRPTARELPTVVANLTTLEHQRWDDRYLAHVPTAPPSGLRLLAELVDAREAVAAARLPLAIHGHMPGFPVRKPGVASGTDYEPTGARIELGSRLVDGAPAEPVSVDLADLTRHALFVGTTGSGKTNSVLALCEQLWTRHRVPFLVIEPVNTTLDDYRWLATRPGMDDLLVLTVGNEQVAPLRLNPFEVPTGVRISQHLTGLLACFDAAFGLWDPLPTIYRRALFATYTRRGLVPSDVSSPVHRGRWPMLADFTERLREETQRLEYAGEVRSNIIAASVLRAESLQEGASAGTLDCATSYPIEELLRLPVVVELADVGDNPKEQALLAALLLQVMTEHYKATRTSGDLAHVTVIEEAHRLLGRVVPRGGDVKEGNAQAKAAEGFANSLAENRKYGEGLVIVEQVPEKLVEDSYKNTNLKVMHRLPAESDRTLVGATMRFSPDQERYAASLEPFTAFAYHDRLDRPALLRVPDLRGEAARAAGLARAPLADDAELARRFRQLATAVPAVDEAVAPFPECAGCRHRCEFRARAETATQAEDAVALKRRVKQYPRTRAEIDTWWAGTVSWIGEVSARVPLTPATVDAQRDYEGCVFVHVVRRAWTGDNLAWIRLYREHAGAGGTGQ